MEFHPTNIASPFRRWVSTKTHDRRDAANGRRVGFHPTIAAHPFQAFCFHKDHVGAWILEGFKTGAVQIRLGGQAQRPPDLIEISEAIPIRCRPCFSATRMEHRSIRRGGRNVIANAPTCHGFRPSR
ncbi:hypothetical protein [Paracoccus sp. SSK6]|uniref:hypothetical protein n=1 Tax=Paracoccus sp. SSK6 TaxID=3143131 RepID=UPI00321AF5E2